MLPLVRIEAVVHDDLRTVSGTLRAEAAALVDPLAHLPDPRDDLQAFRTFPGAPSHGRVAFERNADGSVSFTARLPRRYGTIGATGHGLFASGGWYPQPLGADGRLLLATWDVTVRLPRGATGALGDVLGDDVLRWVGEGERAGLAVVRNGVVTELDAGASDVALLSRGKPRRRLVRELGDGISLLPRRVEGVAVEAPLRRRLADDAPGLAYVSDRAFRLSPGLAFAHREGVARGVAAAWIDRPDPFERDLAAAALGEVVDERLAGLEADRVLGLFSWIPSIDALLSSERIPFYSDVLDRTWPGDPVQDDLAEVFAPAAPGAAVLAQLDDRIGPGTGRRVGLLLAAAVPADEALAAAGAPADFLVPWRREPPPEDYVLSVRAGSVTVGREAAVDAPPEVVVVEVDGARTMLDLAPGELRRLPLDAPPRRVSVDPDLHLRQTSRAGDGWPPRYDFTFAGWVESVNLTQGLVWLGGAATARRQYDTHNLWLGTLSNSESDFVRAGIGYLRKEGPLLDGWTRPHRVRVDADLSLLNPGFSDTDGLAVAVDGRLTYAYDDRVSGDFPLRGKRIGIGAGGGGIPGSDDAWIDTGAHAVGVASFHPRHAVAGRATASAALSTLPHRLLRLGGEGAMRSIPALPACPSEDPCLPVATERGHAALEYRWAPIRGWSVPMVFAWGTELQLAAGAEGLVARVEGEPAWAAGVTAGVLGVGDVLGVESTSIGLVAGWSVASGGIAGLAPSPVPELYLRFEQAF